MRTSFFQLRSGTSSFKDFPASALAPYTIAAEHPDTFLTRLHQAQADVMQQIVRDQAAALVEPPLSVTDVLDALTRHVPRFAAQMRAALEARGSSSAPVV
jgi:hypothetical protein